VAARVQSDYVGFMVDKVAMGEFLFSNTSISLTIFIPPTDLDHPVVAAM
jgi:hypothetical protein